MKKNILFDNFTNYFFFFIILCLAISCTSIKKLTIKIEVNKLLKKSELFSNQFTGFSLLDIESNQIINEYNGNLKFIPASNTKLLTMYVTLKSFPDAIPAFLYTEMDSVIFIKPLGDPTFLYKPFKNQHLFNHLRNYKKIAISWPKEILNPYGIGWAWDDYIYDFQSQRSWWPIYGNRVSINRKNSSTTITPPFFTDYVDVLDQMSDKKLIDRELKFNLFRIYQEDSLSDFEQSIPFDYSKKLVLELLKDTLKTAIDFTLLDIKLSDTLYSQQTDTVLSYMIKQSDNFLAEQLLILAAWQNGFNAIKPFIKNSKSTWLASLTDMIWVDGSGLSRYNLISPIDQVRLLKIMHDEYGWERVSSLLPSRRQGTLEKPFIFAKTGTLSNNHNLSGFLITKSGKRMVFSFMNNNYIRPTKEIKEAMEDFLLKIRAVY